uniref:FHA domain-containing protein n=1 Tax=Ciona savignyi TaxID=51511 RepID=H2Z3E1_CIOSA
MQIDAVHSDIEKPPPSTNQCDDVTSKDKSLPGSLPNGLHHTILNGTELMKSNLANADDPISTHQPEIHTTEPPDQPTVEKAFSLDLLDKKLIEVLALQRLQQLFPVKEKTIKPVPTNAKSNSRNSTKKLNNRVPARAVLCHAITSKCIRMCHRSFSIGSTSENDLVLTNFNACDLVLSRHARITYDKNTQQFELLSYGESVVDGIKYGCNTTKCLKRRHRKHKPPKSKPLTRSIKQVLGSNKENGKENEKHIRIHKEEVNTATQIST